MHGFADPLDMFRTAAARLDADDFLGTAQCCDPVSLRSFKRGIESRFSVQQPVRKMTVKDFMSGDPDMPVEVAEYNLKQFERAQSTRGKISDELPGFSSIDELRAAPAEVVFAEYLDGRSMVRQLRNASAKQLIRSSDAELADMLNAFRHRLKPIAHIEAGPTIGHILFRQEFAIPAPGNDPWAAKEAARVAALPRDEQAFLAELRDFQAPSIALCRRQAEGGWLLIAGYEFLATAVGVVMGMSGEDDPDDEP